MKATALLLATALVLLLPAAALAQTYAILAASTITNTGNSVINAGIALSPGTAITGFPPGVFTGPKDVANAAALAAKNAAQATFTAGQAQAGTVIATALDGMTLTAGVYKTAAGTMSLAQSGAATLTFSGSATDTFVMQTASTLTTGAGGVATITLVGGASAANIFWIVGSSATINAGSAGTFVGNVIAQASITVSTGGAVLGTLSALAGAVTLSAATTINVAGPAQQFSSLSYAPTYGILAASTITNTGSSVITGGLALNPGTSITGFPPGVYSGPKDVANAASLAAKNAAQAAYTSAQAQTATVIPAALDGQTLTAGVYRTASGTMSLATSGPATLTFSGSSTDVFIMQTVGTLVTGAGGVATISLVGGAQASNILWVVGSSATINSGSAGTFVGNVIAQASIGCTLGGTVTGSFAALSGAVTLSGPTSINVPGAPSSQTFSSDAAPAVRGVAMLACLAAALLLTA
jgi:hypothetical protein